jgi:hypothetical protein
MRKTTLRIVAIIYHYRDSLMYYHLQINTFDMCKMEPHVYVLPYQN